MIRAFVAVGLPESVRSLLSEISNRLRRLDLEASFPRPEALHLTLKFLGDIREEQVAQIGPALESAAAGVDGFELRLRRLGCFPYQANPRVVWVGIEADTALFDLQQRIEVGLEALGFPRERQAFQPHLTLARIKSRRNVARLSHFIETEGPKTDLGGCAVTEFRLFRSTLRPEGARYDCLATFPLRRE